MATERTHRLISAEETASKLATAIRARRRLYEEGVKLTRQRIVLDKRLAEIDEEEEILSATIDECGELVAQASANPPEDSDGND
jgi:hypothetical protein